MEIKYTKDGKKVVVIGQINSTEYIVQEIFVTESGDEIPSGEKFTTKSLLDSPLETWQSKQIKQYESKVETLNNEINKIKNQIETYREQQKADAEWLKRNNFLKDKLPEFDWDYFVDVVTGNIQYVVKEGYQGLEIYERSRCENYEKYDHKFEELRAFDIRSIYNNDRGQREYTFNLNRYRDGSGSSDEYVFFKDIESLTEFVTEYYTVDKNINKLTIDGIKKIEKIVKLPDTAKQKVVEKHNKMIDNQYQEMLNKCNKILEGKL